MKRSVKLVCVVAMLFYVFSLSVFADGWDMPDELILNDAKLFVNGVGFRKKWHMKVYKASLYLTKNLIGENESLIIDADQEMTIILEVWSDSLSIEKFKKVTNEAFENNAGSLGYDTSRKDEFIQIFDKIKKINDRYYIIINYIPNDGIYVTVGKKIKKNGKKIKEVKLVEGPIGDLDLKRALLAIWIGEKPVQSSLKNRLLGI